MKVLFELQNINGNVADIVAPDGTTIMYQWAFSQLPEEHWHDHVGESTIADAILDRLVHSAHKMSLDGDSMRKNRNP